MPDLSLLSLMSKSTTRMKLFSTKHDCTTINNIVIDIYFILRLTKYTLMVTYKLQLINTFGPNDLDKIIKWP